MKAFELLATPEKWIKGRLACDSDGTSCDLESERASSWCVGGAICRVYLDSGNAGNALRLLQTRVGNVPNWNNRKERTHAEVLAVLRELDI